MTRTLGAACGLVLALIRPAVPAGASITPEAQGVVDRYLAAVGREAVLGERSVRVRATVAAFGLTGSLEAWSRRPDRSASVTTIGPFTLREGNDGAVAWRVDQNGKLSWRDGRDLEDARGATWFENEQWLMPDQGGGRVTRVGDEADSAGTYAVLEVTPPAGRGRRLWFSTRTGLLERSLTRQDQRTVTTRLSDYGAVAGRLRARTTVIEIEGMPANTARLTLEAVEVNPVLEREAFAPPREGAGDAVFLGDSTIARIPFRYAARHVWIQASLDGGPLEDFLLDTGASVTVVDSAYAARRGLATQGRVEVAGAGALAGATFSQVDSLSVPGQGGGGVVLVGQRVAVLSINAHVEPFFWRPLAGVLGYDFISRFVMEVDFDAGLLTLHDPRRFRYAGPGAGIPMTMAGNIPVVRATLDDRYEGDFRLDVGSGSTVDLHAPFVERHGLRGALGKRFEVVGGGFGGTFTSTIGRMKTMRIGPYAWTDPLVVMSRASAGALSSEDYAGNIGNHLLERFRCTFDYERRVVYLEPGKRYASRDRFSLAGFQLARIDGRVRAMQVLPGSPAARAGLRAGDEILGLDGRAIASYDAEALRAIFEEGTPGRRHALEVLRDGKRRKLTVTLEELL